MAIGSENLIWIDLEMTGLQPDHDRIIEMAVIITDAHLNPIAEAPVLTIHQSNEILAGMDDWNIKHHTQSGLVERVKASEYDEAQAEKIMIDFLRRYISPNKSPMCGNSICQDRRFLYRYMPKLESYFHYRNLDVSTLKELAKRWAPEVQKSFTKKSKHIALEDVKDSIHELKHYREFLFKLS
jgi:oligoribonuclease